MPKNFLGFGKRTCDTNPQSKCKQAYDIYQIGLVN